MVLLTKIETCTYMAGCCGSDSSFCSLEVHHQTGTSQHWGGQTVVDEINKILPSYLYGHLVLDHYSSRTTNPSSHTKLIIMLFQVDKWLHQHDVRSAQSLIMQYLLAQEVRNMYAISRKPNTNQNYTR